MKNDYSDTQTDSKQALIAVLESIREKLNNEDLGDIANDLFNNGYRIQAVRYIEDKYIAFKVELHNRPMQLVIDLQLSTEVTIYE